MDTDPVCDPHDHMVVSRKTGKVVKSDTISSYVSMVKGFFSFIYAFTLVADTTPRLTRLIKCIHDEDPLHGMRRKRRALRRRHLKRAWNKSAELRADTPDAVNKWAAIVTGWHALARGGELCGGAKRGKAKTLPPSRADLSFGKTAKGVRFACLMLRPLKKKGDKSSAPVPQYFQEHDGGGSDAFAALERLARLDPVPESKRASTPLFRLHAKRGKHRVQQAMSGAQFRECVRDIACGILRMGKRRQWGGHSPRIGGATDLASTGECSQLLLQAKGRWGSDIGRIYARMTRRSQLAASKLMQSAKGRDLEELMPDFVQSV